MLSFKPTIRITAIFVFLIAVAGLLIVLNKIFTPFQDPIQPISAPENGGIAINVTEFAFSPFDIIHIQGGGLDSDTATSVIFTTHLGEVFVVPALRVTSNFVTVPIPPVAYKKDKSAFSDAQTSIKVVQIKKIGDKMTTKTSNEVLGRMISAPKIPSMFTNHKVGDIPKGAVTQLFVAVAMESLKSAISKVPTENTELITSITNTKEGMTRIYAAVGEIMKNPNATAELATNTGTTVVLTRADVARLDAFYLAYVSMIEKYERFALSEKSSFLTAVVHAQTANACVENLLSNDLRITSLDSLAIKLCHTIEPENSTIKKTSEDSFNFEYLLQTPLLLTLGLPEKTVEWNAEVSKWGISKQVGVATVLSMGFSYAYDKKLPDWWALGSLAATIYATKYNPFLAEIQFATDMWDNVCAIAPKSWKCLDTRSIILSSAQIFIDIAKNPENLLYLTNAMVGGRLQTLVDELTIPDNQVSVVFENVGIKNGGYGSVKVPDRKPVIPFKKSPANLTPTKKSPIKIEPVYTPVKTTPVSPGPSCTQLREASNKACLAGCPNYNSCYTDYSTCTPGCEGTGNLLTKSNCINSCLGALSKCTGANAKCVTDCNNVKSATQCP